MVSNQLIPQTGGVGVLGRAWEGLGLITVAHCDGIAGVEGPPTPPAGAIPEPEEPVTPPAAPPQPVVIPQLDPPLLSDEIRRGILYARYGLQNYGGDDGLGRMVSIIHSQMIVERSVEAALVADGFLPDSILQRYAGIREYLHSTRQGGLLTPETYQSYVTQIREHGTRQSVPYQRVLQAVRGSHILLERMDGRWV